MAADETMLQYTWILAFGAIFAFAAAFGIGANDVANAYASSVGSGALSIKQACALAFVFEILGATLAGSSVASTIRKDIADASCFTDAPELLMYGLMCVALSTAVWLILASKYEMPVSTTHSCIGGLIGMTMVAATNVQCVNWFSEGNSDNLWIPKGVVGIILSWVFSPVLSGIFAVIIMWIIRTFILRHENSLQRAVIFYPLLVFGAVCLNMFFILSKGISKRICPKSADTVTFLCQAKDNGSPKGKTDPAVAFGISCAVAAGCALLSIPLVRWYKKQVVDRFEAAKANVEEAKISDTSDVKVDVAGKAEPSLHSKAHKLVRGLTYGMNINVKDAIDNDAKVSEIHGHMEVFDNQTEEFFKYIQIFTAICDSFAHGANDVANAMGPFMGIYAIYLTGTVSSKTEATQDDGVWILFIGGLGIGIGLLLYGYKIMRAIGVKLAAITPSRGVSIELGSATVIIIGSYLGLPLSTTHCQVGATVGVGLLEGKSGVNCKLLFKIVVGWVITLIVVGFTCAAFTAQGIYAPLSFPNTELLLKDECPIWAGPNGYIMNCSALNCSTA